MSIERAITWAADHALNGYEIGDCEGYRALVWNSAEHQVCVWVNQFGYLCWDYQGPDAEGVHLSNAHNGGFFHARRGPSAGLLAAFRKIGVDRQTAGRREDGL